jgi:predicted enzyme related to lactoylglutathione lyase
MPRLNHFAIPADAPARAIEFYEQVFGWRFEVAWEYDTPQGREKYWRVLTGDGSPAGIDGGLTRREYPGQPIGVGVEVPSVDACLDAVERCGGKVVVRKVAIPGVAWFGLCQDSEGNTFSIYEPDPSAA